MNFYHNECPGCRSGAAKILPFYARMYEAESHFLEERLRELQTDLEEQLTDLAISKDQDSLPEGQFELLATRQRVGKALRELLQTPERNRHRLECILGARLRRISQQLSALEHTVEDRKAYDEAHRQLEQEGQVFKDILEDWKHRLRDADLGQGKADND
jgi:hypothetical protein